ncbi:S1 family peptidase [Pseudomonas aeruginosa]|uniref:S1 family peptidase n=1 Tax=Pseudomonas aeruginosa TaxID=287 RepID=UPI001557060A|nr:serine protease [Pseudomonas aeruginosa]ELP1284082.1 trypsin-like peptidase domain-containing protein [Pseudomonas aeruginosa]MCT4843202.1 serine protease [Pseudomonas aeruginosa]MDI2331311.1 serine protease [Pseudomonas aeruginosa]MDI2367260.1 serine protease [Pseudomonas aeruginosa]MDL4521209.1 serine protease [Pseudomonas aeruginosa]
MDEKKLKSNHEILRALHGELCGAVAYVAVLDEKGDENIGTAFHIGDGIFVTAKHVVENNKIKEVATTKRVVEKVADELVPYSSGRKYIYPVVLSVQDGPHFPEYDGADVAVFRVDCEGLIIPQIPFGYQMNHSLDDNSCLLEDVLILGYPPIPFTTVPNQVAVTAQINSVIDVRHSDYVHFIASAMARGGFSGGPVISRDGAAIGIVTDSLTRDDGEPEIGFMSVINIGAAVDIAKKIYPDSAAVDTDLAYMETLIDFKFSTPELKRLNSRISSASIFIYDDDRDLQGWIYCQDKEVLDLALDAFNSICRIEVNYSDWGRTGEVNFYMPTNPRARDLIEAGKKARDAFVESGYEELEAFINTWQVQRTPCNSTL